VGGSNSVLTIDTSGAWDGTAGSLAATSSLDVGDFNNDAGYLTTVDISDNTNLGATWPVTLTGDALSWSGLATTSDPTAGQLFYSDGTTGLVPVATSSVTITAPLTESGTVGYVVGGSGWTLDIDDIQAEDLDLTDITLTDFTNDVGFLAGYDAFTHPVAGDSATTSNFIFGSASSTVVGDLNITGNSTTTDATTTNFFSTTASSTNLATTNFSFNSITGNEWSDFCVSITGDAGLCDGADATGEGGAGNIATSSPETSTYVPFYTSTAGTPATLSGGVAGFVFDSTLARLTVTESIFTRSTSTSATSTNFATGEIFATDGALDILFESGGYINLGDPAFVNPYIYIDGTSAFLSGAADLYFQLDASATRGTAGFIIHNDQTDELLFEDDTTRRAILDWSQITSSGSRFFFPDLGGAVGKDLLVATGSQNFILGAGTTTNATSTGAFYSTTASSTNLYVGNSISILNSGTQTTLNGLCIALTGHADLCDGSDDGGASAYDAWTHPSAGVSATTSAMIFTNASSTFTGDLNISGNATATDATTTSFFSTVASTTNFAIGSVFTLFGNVWTSLAEMITTLEANLTLSNLQGAVTDGQVPNNITINLATLATTLTITDNESTSETNAVLFTSGGDLDGGNLGIESDGDLTYNPSSGTLAATVFSGSGASLTAVDAATGDSATSFFDAGTIEHERGGLEVDASAFDGFLFITSGATTATTSGVFVEKSFTNHASTTPGLNSSIYGSAATTTMELYLPRAIDFTAVGGRIRTGTSLLCEIGNGTASSSRVLTTTAGETSDSQTLSGLVTVACGSGSGDPDDASYTFIGEYSR